MHDEPLEMHPGLPATVSEADMDLTACAKRGAAFLDMVCGKTWVNYVDIDRLRLADTDNCVLGQVFYEQAHETDGVATGFGWALRTYALREVVHNEDGYPFYGWEYLGFGTMRNYSVLHQAWANELKERM
jgi:hypothetical protein